MRYTWHYAGCFIGAIPISILIAMLDVFLAKIHGAIPIANPGLIYGVMLFRTFFWRLFLALYGIFFLDANWDIKLDANWDDNCDANWDTNWDINWDAN